MKKITVTILVHVCFLLFFAGCTKEGDHTGDGEDFNSRYGGIPYKGTVHGHISLDEGGTLDLSGDGSIALIEATGDSVSIVFLSDIDDIGEINIKIRGEFDSQTFHLEKESSGLYFRIVDHIISGKFISETQDMAFEGKLEQEIGRMKMVATFKEETESFPMGTRLELNFDTSRKITENDDDGSGCQMRMVPVWGPNGMTMGMVPDC